jgi:hypothetical protein
MLPADLQLQARVQALSRAKQLALLQWLDELDEEEIERDIGAAFRPAWEAIQRAREAARHG